MKIIEYNSYSDIIVQFQDEHKDIVHTQYSSFKAGEVKNYYYPSICGIGYLGKERLIAKNPEIRECYDVWRQMLNRCYNMNTQTKHKSYKDCYVCEEWHNFSNFKEWYYKHKYKCNSNYRLELDKDILVKNNKIYSPDTCILVPNCINGFFISLNKPRIKEIKNKHKQNKFQLMISIHNNSKFFGTYNTKSEAEEKYYVFKKQILIDLCNECKSFMPDEIYKLLINYNIKENINNE